VCTKLRSFSCTFVALTNKVSLSDENSQKEGTQKTLHLSTALKSSKEDVNKGVKATNMKLVKGKCTVQLGLIEALNEIVFTHYSNLNTSHLETILGSLYSCYEFANVANNDSLLQSKLQKTGIQDLLLRQETMAIASYFRILFRMYAETVKDSERRSQIAQEKTNSEM